MDLSETKQFDLAVRPLKLSEAMRIGAKIRPQCAGAWFVKDGSCAIGAVWEATYGTTDTGFRLVGCVISREYGISDYFLGEIIRRNDSGQSRESIADWLEREYNL